MSEKLKPVFFTCACYDLLMTETAILLLGNLHLIVTIPTTLVHRFLHAWCLRSDTVTVSTGTGPDAHVVTGLTVRNLLLMHSVTELYSGRLRQVKADMIWPFPFSNYR